MDALTARELRAEFQSSRSHRQNPCEHFKTCCTGFVPLPAIRALVAAAG
jgi:hypothetical protein